MIFVLEILIVKSKKKKVGSKDATTIIFGEERTVSKMFS
jgi:hypothetical protein